MFPLSKLFLPPCAATQGAPQAGDRRHQAAWQSDRIVSSTMNLGPRPAVGGSVAIARDRPEQEEPWQRQVVGVSFIMGLALRGLVFPVGL
jgi:hypothetical protein